MSRLGKRDMVKEQHWRGVIDDWQQSGLSGAEYCQRHDIKYHNFKDWRREIWKRDQEKPKKAGKPRKTFINAASYFDPEHGKSVPEFVPVQVVDSVSKDTALDKTLVAPEFSLEIVLSKCVLRLKKSCPVELLSSVIAVMEGC